MSKWTQIVGAIDHNAYRNPAFLHTPVRETWLRREPLVGPEWFMCTQGGGEITVMELRAALLAADYAERRNSGINAGRREGAADAAS